MIKGIYIKNLPSLDGISDPEILEEFDVLNEDKYCFTSFTGAAYNMEKREYNGKKNYNFLAISIDDVGFQPMWNIYTTIQQAVPDLFRVIKYTDNVIIVAKHNFKSKDEKERYENLIDELVRIATWLIRDFEDYIIKPTELIKNYFNMCVNVGNKLKK